MSNSDDDFLPEPAYTPISSPKQKTFHPPVKSKVSTSKKQPVKSKQHPATSTKPSAKSKACPPPASKKAFFPIPVNRYLERKVKIVILNYFVESKFDH